MSEEVLAIFADLHCGSTIGLMQDKQWDKQEGGYYMPSPAQKIIYKHFCEGVNLIAELRQGRRLRVVNLGDAVEGLHHDQTQVVTNYPEEQERIHIDLMDFALNTVKFHGDDELYYVGGTPAHVKPGRQSEERIARDLGAIPFIKPTDEDGNDGRFVHDTLTLDINKTVFFMAHDLFRIGSRSWTEDNNIRATLKDVYFRCKELGENPCDWYISAHIHRFYRDAYFRNGLTLNGITCPSYQLKTEYAASKFPLARPTIGMLIFLIDKSGQVTLKESIVRMKDRGLGWN